MPVHTVNSLQKGQLLNKTYKNGNCVIIYHWNSCGHCQSLMPVLNNLLQREKQLLSNSNIFKVEYDDFNYLPRFLTNVSAFPYIVSYKNGEKIKEFDEQRTPDNLKKFIEESSVIINDGTPLRTRIGTGTSKRLLKTYSSSKDKK